MRLTAYTIIEGIVSMVILSLLLSIAVLISFNLYRSFPSRSETALENILTTELDSLVSLKVNENQTYTIENLIMHYEVEPFAGLENVYRAKGTLTDTMTHVSQSQRIFYIDAKE